MKTLICGCDSTKSCADHSVKGEAATPRPWRVMTPVDRAREWEDPDDIEDAEDWSEDYPRDVSIHARFEKPDAHGGLGYQICSMSGVNHHTLPDAHFIVRAVNAHEPMVKAIRFALTTPGMVRGRDELEAALALANQSEEGK